MLLVFHRSEHLNRICSIVEMSSGEIHLDFHSMAISKWEFYKYEILFCICVLGGYLYDTSRNSLWPDI